MTHPLYPSSTKVNYTNEQATLLKDAVESLLGLIQIGDFSNGVITGGSDEGSALAENYIKNVVIALSRSGIVLDLSDDKEDDKKEEPEEKEEKALVDPNDEIGDDEGEWRGIPMRF